MMFTGISTYGDLAIFILRLVLGIIFIYHAIPKLKNPGGMAGALNVPAVFPFILGLAEGLAGLALILGLYTQIAALVIAIVMVGAIFTKILKFHVGFAAQNLSKIGRAHV